MQAGQDINVGGRLARTQYQYTLTDANLDELNEWAPQAARALAAAAAAHRRRLRPAERGRRPRRLTIDRDRASSFGISPALIDATIYDAIGQRQVAQYFTQINSYHVVLEVTPALQADPALFEQALPHLAADRPAGAAVDASSRSTPARRPTCRSATRASSRRSRSRSTWRPASRSARRSTRSTRRRRRWACRRR